MRQPSLSLLFAALLSAFNAQAADAPNGAGASEAKKPAWDVNHPPGPSHEVKLDTRSGTWMSVDVSPDGKTIVFDMLGDLYTLPIGGGEAKSLTHSIAWEQQARFSPDGKHIAYTSDAGGGDNIWVMDTDGGNAHAISKEDFRLMNNSVWHPSGNYILARKHYTGTRSLGSGEIWLYALDGANGGGKGVQLNEKPNWQKDLGEPAISPDGRWLYYSQDSTPGKQFEYNKNANDEIFRIYRQDLRDGSSAPFVTGAGGAIRPTPSPDGKYLAFVRRIRMQSTLFIKDLKSGVERPVWGHLERDMQESWSVNGVYPSFAWMPDSKAVVLWAQGKLWRVDPFKADDGKNGNAAEIPFHVKDTREVREALRVPQVVAPDQFAVRELRWVNVSPDGKQVAYSAMDKLYLKSLPDGAVKRLTHGDDVEMYPSFSRDGKQIVYTSWNDDKLGSVRVLDLASGHETVLTKEPGRYESPRFSPDGKRVVYVKSRGGFLTTPWWGMETGVYLADASGKSEPAKLSDSGDRPQFADTNDAVYVQRNSMSSEVDSVRKLVRIDIADRKEVELAKSDFASEYAVSPDGKSLAFVERFHAYVTALPMTGKAVSVGPKMDALPVRQLDVNAAENMQWSGDSQQLHFSLGDTLFTAPANDAKAKASEMKIGFMQASDKPSGRVVLKGARIATMKGDEVIENGVVVVDGNRIAAIGTAGTVTIPADAQTIDVSGKTIIPGLIDVHWHGAMGDGDLVPQQSWVDYASLALGVTTLHDPSNANGPIFTQSEMQRAGLITAPRIYSTGIILYGARTPFTAVINNLDDALTHLRRQQAHGAISVKSYNQPRREQRQQIIEAARQTGMMVVPEGGSLFEMNMSMIVDGHTGIEHALPVAEVYDDVTQLWTQTQVGYTPTYIVAFGGLDGEHYWYAHTEAWKHPLLSKYVPRSILQARAVRRELAPEEDYNVLRVAASANKLSKAGVEVHIGAHGQREGLGSHWELWTEVLGGMTPLQAIRTATANSAHYLGLDKDIGSLEVGKLADLVVIDGDVLKDIRQSDRIQYVMQNGRVYEAATMNQVAPLKKTRKPLYFEGAKGDGMPVDAELGNTHTDD